MVFANAVTFAALFLASLEDLKSREVPDWLSFALIFTGIGSALMTSITSNKGSALINSFAGLVLAVLLAYLMFYTAQWGGGDSKLLMGIGAIFGFDVSSISGIPILFKFIVNLFVVGAIYGLLWSVSLAIRNWKDFTAEFKRVLYSPQVTLARKINLLVMAVLLIGIILSPVGIKLLLLLLMIFIYATLYLWVGVRAIEKCCMIAQIDVESLTEGDWITHEIKYKGKTIYHPRELGVRNEQIERLLELKQKKVLRKVKVKQGVPFVPSFLLAFIVTLLWPGWIITLA